MELWNFGTLELWNSGPVVEIENAGEFAAAELYNHLIDPNETKNRINEPGNEELLEHLKALLGNNF